MFLWLLLSALSLSLHLLLWSQWPVAVAIESAASLLKPLVNLVHTVTTPGWLLARLCLSSWGEADLTASALACCAGSGVIVLSLLWIAKLRAASHAWLAKAATRKQPSDLQSPPDFSRRKILADAVLFSSAAGATLLVTDAACFAPARLRLQRYTVAIPGLPHELHGLRLAQITDTHLGPRVPAELIDLAIRMAIDLDPHVFLLTGDYIHCGSEWLSPAARQFRPLVESGKPVVSVRGNHDWFNDGERMARLLRDCGIPVIDNDRLFLSGTAGGPLSLSKHPSGPALCLAGLGDLRQHFIDPDAALRDVDPDIPRLVLSHNPDSAEEAAVTRKSAPRIDLMICGHTHGGQVRIPGVGTAASLLSRYGDKYAAGLVRGPACPVLISRGVGISLVPFRFLVPPEVVEITLTRAPDEARADPHTLVRAARIAT